MSVQVPLQAVPAQVLQIVLNAQNCSISIYLKGSTLFMDMAVNGVPFSYAVQARNLVPLVPTVYFGFAGNLVFVDTQGTNDPTYDGLGSRYQLLYLTEADYASVI